jgi:MATE family multidrug resistance protein
VEQLRRLVGIGCAVSLLIGLGCAIGVTWQSDRVFGWLTSHRETLGQVHNYVRWLLPVLGFGSIAYLLDGYFLGLTQGDVLRRSTVLAAVGFGPVAIGAAYFHSNHWLWLALAIFMAVRAVSLGVAVPRIWA